MLTELYSLSCLVADYGKISVLVDDTLTYLPTSGTPNQGHDPHS